MPLVDGEGFLHRLREGHEPIPVTIIRGDYFLDDPTLETLRSLGARLKYKPIWVDELAGLVHAMVDDAVRRPPPVTH
jgi:hypothetical protein